MESQMTSLKEYLLVVVVILNFSRCPCNLSPLAQVTSLSIFTMNINEHGLFYQEIVGIDSIRQLEYFRVPPHNDIAGAEFLLDFKKNMTMIKVPRMHSCYLSKLVDDELPKPRQLKNNMQQYYQSEGAVVTKEYRWRKAGVLKNRAILSTEMRQLCREYPIYRTRVVNINKPSYFETRTAREFLDVRTCAGQICSKIKICVQYCFNCKKTCMEAVECQDLRC